MMSVAYAQPDRGTFVAERQTMVSEQRVALVIGNVDYASGPLRNPANDAKAMADTLRGCRLDSHSTLSNPPSDARSLLPYANTLILDDRSNLSRFLVLTDGLFLSVVFL